MRYGLMGICAVLILGGCPVLDSGRLEPNDSLRVACPFSTDGEIRSTLLAAEALRQSGFSYQQAIAGSVPGCGTFPGCSQCVVAAIAQVYGV